MDSHQHLAAPERWASDFNVREGPLESGEVEVNLGGKLLQGRPGDVIYLPKGIAHAPKVGGNDRLTVIVLCVPGGFDHFFVACAEEFEKGEPEMSILIKLAGEYGIEFQSEPVR